MIGFAVAAMIIFYGLQITIAVVFYIHDPENQAECIFFGSSEKNLPKSLGN